MVAIYLEIDYLIFQEQKNISEVKYEETINSEDYAVMVKNGDTYEEYTSEDNTWPGADYIFKEAKCVDNNGALVDNVLTFADGKATLTTNQTIYCTLYFIKIPEIVKQLKAKDKEVSGGVEHLSDQGGMYRYQGTDDVPNWILFGTREKCEKDEEDKCTNSKLNNMTYDEYVDKYMYRIIGITEEGQMYLIKETFLKEGETNQFVWNLKYRISDCLGEACEWPNVDLYKRLNGTASNGKPIFVDNSYYEYMTKNGDWYNLIADHNWMYGDTIEYYQSENTYNGDYMYAIETGKTATKRYWPDEEQGQETCSIYNQCTEKDYTWSKRTEATKIGLMYMHDIDYAYYDGSSDKSRGNPGSETNVKNSWIHFQKDGYNKFTDYDDEWLITRFGVIKSSDTYVTARRLSKTGHLTGSVLNSLLGARPVFYLTSDVEISGSGTIGDPFTIGLS